MPNTEASTIVFLVSMIIFIIVMITFIIFILFFVQKKQRGFNLELLTVKSNFERELFKAQKEIQEQTLKEISREIHDNILQTLLLARLGLSRWNLLNAEEAKSTVTEISDILENAQDELRHLSRVINSDVICRGGLVKSIETQVSYIQRAGKYDIQLMVEGELLSKNENKDIILFRIIQEALNNILKHAAASKICIFLYNDRQEIRIQIKDNGKGFEKGELNSGLNTTNGINNMEQRAKLINASLLIESLPGQGTQITITAPH
jgi:signal transduction histidine kinase